MTGIIAIVLSIIAGIMCIFEITRLPAFIIAIMGTIFGIISGYSKEQKEIKEVKIKKQSLALEIGAIIISVAVCVSYLIILLLT